MQDYEENNIKGGSGKKMDRRIELWKESRKENEGRIKKEEGEGGGRILTKESISK